MRSHITRGLGIAAGALLLVGGNHVSSASPSDGGHGTRQVAFTLTVTTVGGDVGCDPTDATRCAPTFRAVRTFSGDLAGTSYAVGGAVLLGDGTYLGQDVAQFTGEVAGCGHGTLVMLEEGILDPATGGAGGTWRIVQGRGTGDLAQASGSGTATPDGRAGGTVRCA